MSGGVSQLYLHTTIVHTETNFPAPVLGEIFLKAGVNYEIDGYNALTSPLVRPATGDCSISGKGTATSILEYTGTGAMIKGTGLGVGAFSIWFCTLKGNNTADLFDMSGDGVSFNEIFWTNNQFLDFVSLGSITDIFSISGNFTSWGGYTTGLTISGASDLLLITQISFDAFGPPSTVFDITMPPDSLLQLIGNTATLRVGDSWFNLSEETPGDIFEVSILGNIVKGGIGEFFEIGSLDDEDRRIDSAANGGIPDSRTLGSMFFEENATETVIDVTANTSAITLFADSATEPGVKTTVTDSLHSITDGDSVVILDTTDYNGTYIASNTVPGVSFDITKVFATAETSGTLEEGWFKIAGTTTEGVVERAEMTGNNELTYRNLALEKGKVTADISANKASAVGVNFSYAIFKNGNRVPGTLINRELTNKLGAMSLGGTTTVIDDDEFEVRTRNNGNTENPTFETLSFVGP